MNPLSLSLLALLLCHLTSCTSQPISASVKLPSKSLYVGKRTEVIVTARNVTSKDVFVPHHLQYGDGYIMDGVGFIYSKERKVPFLIGESIDISPPSLETIPAGKSKRYLFYWEPKLTNAGDGYLHVALPMSFSKVRPIPIRVINPVE